MKHAVNLIVVSTFLYSSVAMSKSRNEFDYWGVSISDTSYSNLNVTPDLDEDVLLPLNENINSASVSLRGYYGYQFNRYLAAEAGLNYFGKNEFSFYSESESNGVITQTTEFSGEFKALGADFKLIATYPITNSFYLKASVGALYWDSKKDILVRNEENFVLDNVSESGTSVTTGFGVAYAFGRAMSLSLDVEKSEIADADITTTGISFTFRF